MKQSRWERIPGIKNFLRQLEIRVPESSKLLPPNLTRNTVKRQKQIGRTSYGEGCHASLSLGFTETLEGYRRRSYVGNLGLSMNQGNTSAMQGLSGRWGLFPLPTEISTIRPRSGLIDLLRFLEAFLADPRILSTPQ